MKARHWMAGLAAGFCVMLGGLAQAQEYGAQDMQAALQSIGCHPSDQPFDGSAYDRALRCFQTQIGAPTGQPMSTEQWQDLLALGEITGEPDEFGVSDGMRVLLRNAFDAFRGPEPYDGPVWAGTEARTLIAALYSGDTSALGAGDTRAVQAALVSLLINHAAMVRDFGDSCLFAGDTGFLFTLDEPGNVFIRNSPRQVYEQKFWVPKAYERIAGAAFVVHDVRPGLTSLRDLGRIVWREDCGSLRLALLRENMLRFLNNQPAATLEDMQARYGTDTRPAPVPKGAGIPADWTQFARTCFRERRSLSTKPPQSIADYCACFERHLRSADLEEVYRSFVANWKRATRTYWNTPVLNPIGQFCSARPRAADADHASELLALEGVR